MTNTQHMEARTISIAAAAKLLGVGRNQAYEAARTGQLPAFRIGRRWLVPVAALEKMIRGS